MIGSALTTGLQTYGLKRLPDAADAGRWPIWTGVLSGCAAGAAAVRASTQAGTWWVTPALVVWACALVAAATCDALTQRIPTSLVRPAGLVTSVLLITGLSLSNDWRGLVTSGVAAAAAGLIMLLCWRFAELGFGDVRLATLGGLGLGHASERGLVIALAGFVLITLVQATVVLARGGDSRTRLPYGPALATGFLLAAVV